MASLTYVRTAKSCPDAAVTSPSYARADLGATVRDAPVATRPSPSCMCRYRLSCLVHQTRTQAALHGNHRAPARSRLPCAKSETRCPRSDEHTGEREPASSRWCASPAKTRLSPFPQHVRFDGHDPQRVVSRVGTFPGTQHGWAATPGHSDRAHSVVRSIARPDRSIDGNGGRERQSRDRDSALVGPRSTQPRGAAGGVAHQER
jgi:hypothetical protein